MTDGRTVAVDILLDTTVNGRTYTAGQTGVMMTPAEAKASVRDKAARYAEQAAPAPVSRGEAAQPSGGDVARAASPAKKRTAKKVSPSKRKR